MTKLKLRSIIIVFIVLDHYVYPFEACPSRTRSRSSIYNVRARGNHDTFANPTCLKCGRYNNCTALNDINAYCFRGDTNSSCLECRCLDQYKTYLRYFGKCVRNNRLLFFPVGNSSFLILRARSKTMVCITYDRLHRNITSAICNSNDALQHWIWTQYSQILNVETSKCIQQGQAYRGSPYTWYLNLEECNITETKQKWSCGVKDSLRQTFYYSSGQADYMYMTLENGLILAKPNIFTGWKRLQVQRTRQICYSSSGCNEYTNPTSSLLVLDKKYQRQGEQQIAVLAGTRNCFVSPNQLQYLDYKSWRQLEFNETIFAISKRTSGTFLKWDFTRAPFHWTDSIIRLNFNCTINFHIKEKRCVLIKLKGLSNYVQTTKSDPGPRAYTYYNATNVGTKPEYTDVQTTKSDPGPTAYTYYNATNVGTKPECTDCATPKFGFQEESTNSIPAYFVGGAVTLAIVLVVLVVIFIIYKRRRQAPKLSTDVVAVDAVQMQNRSPGEHSQDNQGQDNVIPVGETTPGDVNTPIDDGTAPYEEVQISPPSVYAELYRNQHDGNDHLYQGLIKRDSDYVIPAHTKAEPSYEEVGKKKSPSGYQELDITKRVQDDGAYYQKLIKK